VIDLVALLTRASSIRSASCVSSMPAIMRVSRVAVPVRPNLVDDAPAVDH